MGARARRAARFRASPGGGRSGADTTVTREPRRRATSALPSVEPPSTRINSQSGKRLRRQAVQRLLEEGEPVPTGHEDAHHRCPVGRRRPDGRLGNLVVCLGHGLNLPVAPRRCGDPEVEEGAPLSGHPLSTP